MKSFTKKPRRLFLVFCVTFISATGWGQNLEVTNAPVPPSPAAASILKSVDMPVSYYTGAPEISIPLFNLSGTDLHLPINLVFNSNGFKVDEVASWVGSGWNLSCSGAIARTIMDAPDNYAFGYHSDDMDHYYNAYNIPKLDSCAGNIYLNSYPFWFYTFLSAGTSGQPTFYDTEPDIYSFSLPSGEGGKFLVNREKEIRAIPRTRTRIEMYSTGGGINDYSFNIRDEHGTGYEFGNTETITSSTFSSNPYMNGISRLGEMYPVNSWYIHAIRSGSSKEVITFGYAEEETIYDGPTLESKGFLIQPTFGWDETGINYGDVEYTSYSHNIVSGKRLGAIYFENYIVNFIADETERSDLEGGHRLSQVVVLNDGDTIKNFMLYHSYIGAEQFLRLDSVVEFGRGGIRMPAYKFTYHSTLTAPARNSKDKDYWGYYNNAGNLTQLPTYQLPGGDYPINFIGGNREPSAEAAQYGMPSVIQYPTGGRMEYDYELNTYSRFGIEREKIPQSATVFVNPASTGNTQEGVKFINEDYFTVADTTYAWVSAVTTCDDTEGIPADCGIILLGQNVTYSQGILSTSTNSYLMLLPGTYKLRAEISIYRTEVIGALIKWNDRGDTLTEKPGPGVRVKEIRGYDKIHEDPVLVKRLEYKMSTGESSGLLHDHLRFDYDYRRTNNHTNPPLNAVCFDDYPYALRVLQSNSLNSFTGGGTILGYDRVEETQVVSPGDAIASNGKTVHEFYNEFVPSYLPSPLTGQPNTPLTATSGFSGKLKSEKYYASSEQLVKESYHTYQQSYPEYTYGWQVAPRTIENCKKCDFIFGQYVYESIAIEADTTVEITYSGSEPFVQTSISENEFITDVPDHDAFYIKRNQRVFNSTGSSVLNEYKYSFDFTGQSTQTDLNTITAFNKLSPIYQLTVNQKDTTVIGGRLLNFEANGVWAMSLKRYFDIELEAPAEYASIDPGSDISQPPAPFVLKSTYNYAEDGQISSINKADDISRAFIWAIYDPLLLIAEVQNASDSTVYFNGFEETGDLDSEAKTGRKTRESDFTFSPPGGLSVVANSTLSYWYWSENEWIYKEVSYSGGNLLIEDGTKIDELRIFPPGAQMTTYSHHPGVGVVSVTDPNNITRKYEYDEFNRLSVTRDKDGNILQAYRYVYNLK